MVKYCSLDGKVLTSRWVNSGLDMLEEKFEPGFGQLKANGWFCEQNRSLLEVLSFILTVFCCHRPSETNIYLEWKGRNIDIF